MSLRQKLMNVQMKVAQIEKTPLIAKPALIEGAVNDMVDLIDSMIESIELVADSYNGLLAYVNQISDDPMAVNELNANMKAAGERIYGER